MQIEIIKARIDELMRHCDQSAANHNAIIGRLAEAKEMLKMLEDEKKSNVVDGQASEIQT